MKKNTFTRMMALLITALITFATFTGCTSYGPEVAEAFGVETANASELSVNDNNDASQNTECAEKVRQLEEQLAAVNNALADAEASLKTFEAENADLKAENEELVAELNAEEDPFIAYGEDGWPTAIGFEDALEILAEEMANNTIAYKVGEGRPIDIIDEVIIDKVGKPYAEQTFMFAHHKGSPYVIVGVDANGNTQTYQVVYGSALYEYNQSWAQPKTGEGFELLETSKIFNGSDLAMNFAMAICVYEVSEGEYSLCLNVTGEYVAPSKPSAPPVSEPEVKPEEPKEETPKEDEPEVPDTPVIPDTPIIPDIPDEPEDPESDHNDLEDIPDHNEGEGDSEHNEMDEVPNPSDDDFDTTLNPEDGSNDEGGEDQDTDHNFVDNDPEDIISDDEVIDTTLIPEDSSNDEGSHSFLEELVVEAIYTSTHTSSSSSSSSSHSSLD